MAASLHLGLLVLGTVSLLGRCEVKLNAGCKIETLRACRDDYVPYKKGPHLHESGQEFDEGCKKDKTQIPCTLKFINECTDGLPKATALVAIKALEENIEAICNIGSDPYENYQKGIKCMNSQGGKLHKCIKDFVSIMERAIVKAPAKDVIHYTCCSYYDAVECLSKSLTPCESVGSKDFMIRVVEEMFGETLNLVCGRYTKGSENCKSLPQLPRLGAKDRRVNNIVEILLEAAGTLGRKH